MFVDASHNICDVVKKIIWVCSHKNRKSAEVYLELEGGKSNPGSHGHTEGAT